MRGTRAILGLTGLSLFAPNAVRAAQSSDPEFEVASTRPAPAPTMAMMQSGQIRSRMDDAMVDFSNIPLMTLITIAFDKKPTWYRVRIG